MEGEEGGGMRLSKRFSDKSSGEVDYKNKSGTAWSHSYLNQKPWHPLSYPNQRRKWIAEQTHNQRDRRAEEVAREYAQEQEFFRQTALISKKEKEKMEMMKAVSFMYIRPPGYNPESAKAADIADERKMEDQNDSSQNPHEDIASAALPPEHGEVKKKPRPKDVFGRSLPTQEEFEVLKNAPRLETGIAGRAKPFGVEVRNVKCVRCGTFGHQSGDRECPLKDVIMPNEESRLKRDDPLTAILAHTDPGEPLKWELKQKPGMSPPRGGFKPDDPNQQIVAEDIFDEYGGFLGDSSIPELLTNFTSNKIVRKKSDKKSRRKKKSSKDRKESEAHNEDGLNFLSGDDERSKEKYSKKKKRRTQQNHSESSSPDTSESGRHHKRIRQKHSHSKLSENSDHGHRKSKSELPYPSGELGSSEHHARRRHKHHRGGRKSRHDNSYSSEESESSGSSENSDHEMLRGRRRSRHKHPYSSGESGCSESETHHKRSKHKRSDIRLSENYDSGIHRGRRRRRKGRHEHSSSSEDSDSDALESAKHHHSRSRHERPLIRSIIRKG